jgi:hypothetical protein
MTRLNGTWAAALLVAATLAFGGCGGDDESDTSTTGAGAVETTTGTTGTTESGTTRERTGTNEDRTERTETRERGDDTGGGGSGGGSDDSGNGSGSGSGGGGSGSQSEELTAGNTFSTARTVCRNFLPKPLEKDLKDGDKSAADIAKDYSRGFPSELRKRAYDGCVAGLRGKD